jgi:hypothetical protein
MVHHACQPQQDRGARNFSETAPAWGIHRTRHPQESHTASPRQQDTLVLALSLVLELGCLRVALRRLVGLASRAPQPFKALLLLP